MISNLPSSYLSEENVLLNAVDLAIGLSRGFISATTVIEIATSQNDCDDSVLRKLSFLLSDQADRVEEILEPFAVERSEQASRKWLYLVLKALWIEQSEDRYSLLELIYAEFEYPPVMQSFVGYMPATSAKVGLAVMEENWQAYLSAESAYLKA